MRIDLYIEKNIWLQHQKWTKCYTNKILHFDNIIILRSENNYRVVKEKLQFSIGDLYTVTTRINVLLDR